jgi:hypothetical protein
MNKGWSLSLWRWLNAHSIDAAVLLIVLAIGFTVSAANMTSYPQRFEDEGTYVSQAWAVKDQGTLAHYTYWYDHPPAGWIQIAAWLAMTDSLDRYSSSITAGREFMLVVHLLVIVLLYALARRLRVGTTAAGIGVLLYALSPLSVEFGRYVFLDNVALPWLLGAFLLALSPRRSLGAAIGTAVCMAIAILSKETLLVLLPVIVYYLWHSGDTRNRRYTMTAFAVVFTMICFSYILYAALKNELIPGPGHVSLLGSLYWQLVGRAGSGSIFDKTSGSYGLFTYWFKIDPFLISAGFVSMFVALAKKNLRPIGIALLISYAMLLRKGYLPFPYIIVLLPFAALAIAGALDTLLQYAKSKKVWQPYRLSSVTVFAELLVAIAVIVMPIWLTKLHTDMTLDQDASSRQAVSWVATNVPRTSRIVVESALWVDLETRGFTIPKPVWLYKTETDPAVKAKIHDWRGLDYVILNGPTIGAKNFDTSFPIVSDAMRHGKVVATFGTDNQKVLVYKVVK